MSEDFALMGDVKVGRNGVSAIAGMHADLGNRLDKIERILSDPNPVIKTVGGSKTITGAFDQVICSEMPSRGRLWNILKVVLTSTDGHTLLTGVTVDMYAGTGFDAANPTLFSLIQGNLPVPSVTYWSKDVEFCQAGENVFGLVYGGTLGQLVNLSVRVREFAVPAYEAMHV